MGVTGSRPKHLEYLESISLSYDNETATKRRVLFAWLRRGEGKVITLHKRSQLNIPQIVSRSSNQQDTQHLMEWYDSMARHKKEGRFRFYGDPIASKLVVAFDPLMNGKYLSLTPIDKLNTLTAEEISPAVIITDTEQQDSTTQNIQKLKLPAKVQGNPSDDAHVIYSKKTAESVEDAEEVHTLGGGGRITRSDVLAWEARHGRRNVALRRAHNAWQSGA